MLTGAQLSSRPGAVPPAGRQAGARSWLRVTADGMPGRASVQQPLSWRAGDASAGCISRAACHSSGRASLPSWELLLSAQSVAARLHCSTVRGDGVLLPCWRAGMVLLLLQGRLHSAAPAIRRCG